MVSSVRPTVDPSSGPSSALASPPSSPPASSGSLLHAAPSSRRTLSSAAIRRCAFMDVVPRSWSCDGTWWSAVELLAPAAVLQDELLGLRDHRRISVDLVLPDRDVLRDSRAERLGRLFSDALTQ